MKTVTIILSLLLLASPVFGQLTKEDIRTIVKEEVTASEKRTREYIDLKIDALGKSVDGRFDAVADRFDALGKSVDDRFDALGKSMDSRFDAVDKKLDWVWYMMIALIGLVTAAIAVPQIIMAYRERGRKEMETRQEALQTEIQQLRERLAALEHPPS